MINTYGYKMVGLESASAKTSNCPIGIVNIIRYDAETGDVWVSDATSDQLSGRYDVFRTTSHVSPQRIADEIVKSIELARLTPQARYDLANTVTVSLKLNRKTDADIIAVLDKQENKQGYIKSIIRGKIAVK